MAIGTTSLDCTKFEPLQTGAQMYENIKVIDSVQISKSMMMNRSNQSVSIVTTSTSTSTPPRSTTSMASSLPTGEVRLKERLFRVISKVPVQVESISPDQYAANNKTYQDGPSCSYGPQTTETCGSSERAKASQRADYANRPVVIKYYNEKSLYEIIELHFRCSLSDQTGASDNGLTPASRRLVPDPRKSLTPQGYYALNGESRNAKVGIRPTCHDSLPMSNNNRNNNGPQSMSSSSSCGLQSSVVSSVSGWHKANQTNMASDNTASMQQDNITNNPSYCTSRQLSSVDKFNGQSCSRLTKSRRKTGILPARSMPARAAPEAIDSSQVKPLIAPDGPIQWHTYQHLGGPQVSPELVAGDKGIANNNHCKQVTTEGPVPCSDVQGPYWTTTTTTAAQQAMHIGDEQHRSNYTNHDTMTTYEVVDNNYVPVCDAQSAQQSAPSCIYRYDQSLPAHTQSAYSLCSPADSASYSHSGVSETPTSRQSIDNNQSTPEESCYYMAKSFAPVIDHQQYYATLGNDGVQHANGAGDFGQSQARSRVYRATPQIVGQDSDDNGLWQCENPDVMGNRMIELQAGSGSNISNSSLYYTSSRSSATDTTSTSGCGVYMAEQQAVASADSSSMLVCDPNIAMPSLQVTSGSYIDQQQHCAPAHAQPIIHNGNSNGDLACTPMSYALTDASIGECVEVQGHHQHLDYQHSNQHLVQQQSASYGAAGAPVQVHMAHEH